MPTESNDTEGNQSIATNRVVRHKFKKLKINTFSSFFKYCAMSPVPGNFIINCHNSWLHYHCNFRSLYSSVLGRDPIEQDTRKFCLAALARPLIIMTRINFTTVYMPFGQFILLLMRLYMKTTFWSNWHVHHQNSNHLWSSLVLSLSDYALFCLLWTNTCTSGRAFLFIYIWIIQEMFLSIRWYKDSEICSFCKLIQIKFEITHAVDWFSGLNMVAVSFKFFQNNSKNRERFFFKINGNL